MISPIFVPFSGPNCKLSLNMRGVTRHFWKRFVAINFDPGKIIKRLAELSGEISLNLFNISVVYHPIISDIFYLWNSEVSWRAYWYQMLTACWPTQILCPLKCTESSGPQMLTYTTSSSTPSSVDLKQVGIKINRICRILLCKWNATIIPPENITLSPLVAYDNDLVMYASTSMHRHLTMSKHHFH